MSELKISASQSGNVIVIHYKGNSSLNIQEKTNPVEFKRVAKLIERGQAAEGKGNFDELDKVKEELVAAYVDVKKSIEAYSKEHMSVADGKLVDKKTGKVIPHELAKKLIEFKKVGEKFDPLWRFWCKLRENPSENSKQQLYTWMEKNKVVITELGDIVLEKGVHMMQDGSLWDEHTKTFDNSIGMVVEMNRKDVQDDPNQTCSAGLHVAAPAYVRSNYSQSVVVECLVSPKDVVSVPKDYNATKMRVCRYQVVALAKHSSIEKLVMKMEDFVELPKIEERREHGKSDVPTNTFTDLMKLTAGKIIAYVKEKTGKKIKLDPKNKKAIAKKAEQILTELGHADLPNSEAKKNAVKEIVFTGKLCKEVIKVVEDILGAEETAKHAGNDPRRGRFIAKVTPILKEKGYTVVD